MMSLTSVVAANSTEAPAPRVAFTRMFHAPSKPADGQGEEPEVDSGAGADEWEEERKQHEREVDRHPRQEEAGRNRSHADERSPGSRHRC